MHCCISLFVSAELSRTILWPLAVGMSGFVEASFKITMEYLAFRLRHLKFTHTYTHTYVLYMWIKSLRYISLSCIFVLHVCRVCLPPKCLSPALGKREMFKGLDYVIFETRQVLTIKGETCKAYWLVKGGHEKVVAICKCSRFVLEFPGANDCIFDVDDYYSRMDWIDYVCRFQPHGFHRLSTAFS